MADAGEGWDVEVDFVSVGSGCGGLSAAITAHDAGLETLILEKSGKVGGALAYSGGEVWCWGNNLAREAGIEDSVDEVRSYMHFISGGQYLEANQEAFIHNAPVVVDYLMEKAGVRLQLERDAPDYYFPDAPGSKGIGRMLEPEPIAGSSLGEWQSKVRTSPHSPPGITRNEIVSWGGLAAMDTWDPTVTTKRAQEDMRTQGPGLAAHLAKAACIDRGISCETSARALQLITRDGAVVGLRAQLGGGEKVIRARKGVVLATSGYDGDPAVARAHEHAPLWGHTALFPGLTGDGLVMGAEIGAEVATVPQDQSFPGLPALPGVTQDDGAPVYRLPHFDIAVPHGIIVDEDGRRFADESFYPQLLTALQEFDGKARRLKHFPCFMVIDQDHRDRYGLGGAPAGKPLPEGYAVQAPTLRALAEALGVNAAGLEQTVERFNHFARSGEDPDFGRGHYPWSNAMGDASVKPNPNLGPIERAPFYGVRMTLVTVGIDNAGLMIDENANVRHVRGHPIPGLYAAGNAAAYVDLMRGYQSGFANCRGLVFGHLAAKHAANRP